MSLTLLMMVFNVVGFITVIGIGILLGMALLKYIRS